VSNIIVALDYDNEQAALDFVEQVTPELCKLKVGKGMFTQLGPDFVKKLIDRDFDVFLDLKFHDIPQTVASACKAAAALGVWMLNVHACGGLRMMRAAREAIDTCDNPPILIAVTVLTSMESNDLLEIGVTDSVEAQVLKLARLTQDAGLDGVVCSAQEASLLRKDMGDDFCLVTPGIRLADSKIDDQRRIVTPETAIANGANYIVIGRPITQSKEPKAALTQLIDS